MTYADPEDMRAARRRQGRRYTIARNIIRNEHPDIWADAYERARQEVEQTVNEEA